MWPDVAVILGDVTKMPWIVDGILELQEVGIRMSRLPLLENRLR